jgi:hypothetical protein
MWQHGKARLFGNPAVSGFRVEILDFAPLSYDGFAFFEALGKVFLSNSINFRAVYFLLANVTKSA